jgi:hypothetical protein
MMKFKVKRGDIGFPTYVVLCDGVEIGTVKIEDHNRWGNLWESRDLNGRRVAQSRTRRGAAEYLMERKNG